MNRTAGLAEPVVLISALRCEFAGRAALDLPRLAIHAGERVAIVGHNGAGKSTLLRCLSAFLAPTQGQITVLGQRIDGGLQPGDLRALRRQVGQVMQGLHLVHRLTVLENVLIGTLGRTRGAATWRSWARWYAPAEVDAAHQALVAVGLLGQANARADRLSGGERQKVAIARMLVQQPRLILADEPTASLDPAAAREVCNLLVLAARGKTLLTVVHDTRVLPLLADRVIGLAHGRLVFDLPVSAVDEPTLGALYRNNRAHEISPRTGTQRIALGSI